MNLPAINQRIQLSRPYWFDPHKELPQGLTGKVTSVGIDKGQLEPTIAIKLDQPCPSLENDMFSFYPQCGPEEDESGKTMNTVGQFYYYCNLID